MYLGFLFWEGTALNSPLELMDSFSETLLRDERILGFREKELLTNLLQRANGRDAAVNQAIAQTVGEIVAQRACEVLGSSITRRLVAQASAGKSTRLGPSPPGPGPHPPGPGVSKPMGPSPPGPGPHPPGPGLLRQVESGGVAVMDEPSVRFANCVILDEFLAPAEASAVLQFALDHESAFQVSEVVSPGTPGSAVDYDHRRSLVLMDLGPHRDTI